MKRFQLVLLLVTVSLLSVWARAASASEAGDYLTYVRRYADTMIEKGRDTYGPKKTSLWCGVINVEDFSVPQAGDKVLPPSGVRAHDRALGGCNLYHDVVALRTLRVLSRVTGEARYEQAVREYVRDFLSVAQSPTTGLLAWGEHLYYDVHKDAVDAERKNHELLEWTAPWDLLWEVDPAATQRAIAGLQYHFLGPDPAAKKWIFNRHAYWAEAKYQGYKPQPWVKHSALYAHGFLFLYSKTQDSKWLNWANGIGSLYWDHRNPKTNLTEGCIGDPRPTSRQSTFAGTGMLCYWLLKAGQLNPQDATLRTRALTLLKALDHYGWKAEKKAYQDRLNTDGTPASKEEKASNANPWVLAYGDGSGMLRFGRVAAFAAATEKDAECLEMAKRAASVMAAAPLPANVTPEEIGFALQLSLDLYDLTKEPVYLADARRYADIAIEKLWTGSLFMRRPRDRWYESKVGPGDLVAGLLRLHLRLNDKVKDPGVYDWSF